MPWADRLKPATFRGLPFMFDEDSREGGRRLIEHNFPGFDEPEYEDLGRLPRSLRVRAIILGPDFDLRTERFVSALERRGAGDLVLPTRGALLVLVETWAVSQSRREGANVATFEISFRQIPPQPKTAPESLRTSLVDARAGKLDLSAASQASGALSLIGVPEWVREAAADTVRAVGTVIKGLRVLQGAQREVLSLTNKATALIRDASELATSPVNLANAVISAMQTIESVGMSGINSLYAYRQFFGMNPDLQFGRTSLSGAANRNRTVVTHLARLGAVSGSIRAGERAEFLTVEDAEEARTAIENEMDDLDDDLDDATFEALQDLRVELWRSVPAPNLRPLQTITVTPPGAVPAVVLAYRYLNDVDAAEEIATLNRARHPLFMPGIPTRMVARA